jgi:fucose permease
MISFAGRHMATTGKTTAWFFVGASSGGMLIPWLIGQWFESTGPRVTVFIILASLFLNLAMFGVIIRYVQRSEKREV